MNLKKLFPHFFILLLIAAWFYYSHSQERVFQEALAANETRIENSKSEITKKLSVVLSKLDSDSFTKQKEFYNALINQIETFSKNDELNPNIIPLFSHITSILETKFFKWKKAEEIRIKQEKENSIIKHTSLILRFSRNGNHNSLIQKNRAKIAATKSVFIFKSTLDLTNTDIKTISANLKAINPKILIFIDQEWWWINRYKDFNSKAEVDLLFNKGFIAERLKSFTKEEQTRMRNIFPQIAWYYPSLEKIGKTYDTFSTTPWDNDTTKARVFLEIVAYMRLESLKSNGINTYWLILDLNRGNPVITGYARSFSRHVSKYKLLVDAFALASKETGVRLYFKHFPWHGAWAIDSHKWVLSYAWKEAYLQENFDLFAYAIEKIPSAGIMAGHMYLPNMFQNQFSTLTNKTSFILSDDLWMQWYKLATWKVKPWLFFSTDLIANSKKLIIVDTWNNAAIY